MVYYGDNKSKNTNNIQKRKFIGGIRHIVNCKDTLIANRPSSYSLPQSADPRDFTIVSAETKLAVAKKKSHNKKKRYMINAEAMSPIVKLKKKT